MKKLFTALCCIALATTGYLITSGGDAIGYSPPQGNTLYAATIPYEDYSGQAPLDLLLDQAKRLGTDTVFVEIRDTVTVKNVKYVKVPMPEHTTDTLYIPMTDLPEIEVKPVKQQDSEDREEYTSDETRDGPKPIVVLTIDGKVVYASENDIHSDSIQNGAVSVPDEP